MSTMAKTALKSAGFPCMAILLMLLWMPPSAASEPVKRSDLVDVIIEYAKGNPDASLADVVAFANAELPEHGMIYEFYRDDQLPGDRQMLDAGDRQLTVEMADPDDSGPCGEHWAWISAIHADDQWIYVIDNGERVRAKRPEGLYLDTMTVYTADQRTRIAELHIPRQIWPSGVSRDGQTVFITYPLFEKDLPWWSRIKTKHREIAYEYPFLMLAVGPTGVRFVDDPALYLDSRSEEIEEFPGKDRSAYLKRWRFTESGLVVEFQMPCT